MLAAVLYLSETTNSNSCSRCFSKIVMCHLLGNLSKNGKTTFCFSIFWFISFQNTVSLERWIVMSHTSHADECDQSHSLSSSPVKLAHFAVFRHVLASLESGGLPYDNGPPNSPSWTKIDSIMWPFCLSIGHTANKELILAAWGEVLFQVQGPDRSGPGTD